MSLRDDINKMRNEAPSLAASSHDTRISALKAIGDALLVHKDEIFAANRKDLEAAKKSELPEAILGRLKFDEHKLKDTLSQLKALANLPDPIGKVDLLRELDDDLLLKRISCPIGVVGVIFEARPDALVQISSLCIKSGNAAILKGGKETAHTNRCLFELIRKAAISSGLPEHSLLLCETHADIDELLTMDDCVDLLIPRGSNKFVSYIMQHTKIPVMGHSSGICHIYVDKAADFDLACKIIVDAKTQYPVACNAVETILVNKDIADVFYPKFAEVMAAASVAVRANSLAYDLLTPYAEELSLEEIGEDDFATEYGDYTLATKVVDDIDAAISHINHFGSHHTDCIVSANEAAAEHFSQLVDSASIYHNVSTRFADGFRYGFGAEVGISTGKLHARGPVGLEGMMSYKYLLSGKGNIVADYAKGKRHFTHVDLPLN